MTDSDTPKNTVDDPTGQERLTWNVFVSWATQLVSIVIGFVMPRLIHESLGQVSLGIWDFGWAIVSYLALVNFGVGSNSSRWVAVYRHDGRIRRLIETVSSAHAVQMLIGTTVVLATIAISSSMEWLLPETVQGHLHEAKLVVLLLGLSFATQMYFDAYRGILTGCHRWDIHNGVNTCHYVLSAIGMVVTLLLGYELIALAAVYLASTVFTEVLRFVISRRVCPEAELATSAVNLKDIKRTTMFGFKNLATVIGPLVVQQTVNVLVTMRLGPAMLAVFARPTALVRHIEVFILKFAHVLMPTASSLQGMGEEKEGELRTFALDMSKAGWALAVPAAVFLLAYGPALIELWMGPDYVVPSLIWILAIGGCLIHANRPAYRILFGMNRHGRASIASLIIFAIVFLIGVPGMLWFDGGLLWAATMYVAGDVIFHCVIVTRHLARELQMSTLRYLWDVAHRAIVIGVVCYAALAVLQSNLQTGLVVNLLLGAAVHGGLVAVLYWSFMLSEPLKAKLWSMTPLARSV